MYEFTLKRYISDKLKILFATALSLLFTVCFLKLIGIRWAFILLLLIMMTVPCTLVWITDYFHKRAYYNEMNWLICNLDQKSMLTEICEEPDFLEGRVLYSLLLESEQYMNNRIAEEERNMKEYREYIESWVHEIKTPLTLANLLCSRQNNLPGKQISEQLFHVDGLVEQALYYARSASVEKDFLAQKVTLHQLVVEALKQNARLLVEAKAVPQMEQLDYSVYADAKWIAFILTQVITNSVKYRKADEPLRLTFRGYQMEECIRLQIQDNGVGIESSDLERIFEKGFTGTNGRNHEQSTGIGLYLCKKLCQKMNLTIWAESENGTSIYITFPVSSMTQVR